MKNDLLNQRKKYDLTLDEVSNVLKIPKRTYIRYEKDPNYGDKFKRENIIKILKELCEITETKGLISLDYIKKELNTVLIKHKKEINFIYLYGSYAKGYQTEKSDIDLCISTSLKGLKFLGLREEIKKVLVKNVDLIDFDELADNKELIYEIMKDGIKIYG